MGGPGMGPLRDDQKWIALLEVYGEATDASARALTKEIHAVLDKYKKGKKIKGFDIKFNVVGGKQRPPDP
jgi:hypothetical protein